MKRSNSATVTQNKTSHSPARGGVRRHSAHLDPDFVEAPASAMRPRGQSGGRSGESENGAGRDESPKMLSRVKDAVLHLLSHHERLLLVLWYVERMTVAEIARTLNLTEQQAGSMHADVLSKLRLAG